TPEPHGPPRERDLGLQPPLLPNPAAVAAGRLGGDDPALEHDGPPAPLLQEERRRAADDPAADDRDIRLNRAHHALLLRANRITAATPPCGPSGSPARSAAGRPGGRCARAAGPRGRAPRGSCRDDRAAVR